MTSKLAGKIALITGASQGIGAEIARQFAAAGAAVVVNYAKSKADAEAVVRGIKKAGGEAVAIQANVARQRDITRLFNRTIKLFERLDILVNNAGVYEFAPLEQVTEAHYRKMFDLNFLGLLLCCKEAAKHFGDRGGNILNISSVASMSPLATTGVYAASKAAVDSLTRTLALELGPRKIRVNALNPGMVDTEGVRKGGEGAASFRKFIEAQTPLGRIGVPQDIAPAAVFLASDDSSWLTGETIVISGGLK